MYMVKSPNLLEKVTGPREPGPAASHFNPYPLALCLTFSQLTFLLGPSVSARQPRAAALRSHVPGVHEVSSPAGLDLCPETTGLRTGMCQDPTGSQQVPLLLGVGHGLRVISSSHGSLLCGSTGIVH